MVCDTITKKELCQKLGISSSTLNEWLNKRYYNELVKLGYRKTQKILLPAQYKFLYSHLAVSDNDNI